MHLLLLAIVAVLLVYCVCSRTSKKVLKEFPQPPGHFFFGNTLEFRHTTKRLEICLNYLNKYGSTLRLEVGPFITALLTSDYKFIQFLTTNNKILTKSENYQFLNDWLGNGILLSSGSLWRKYRKIITPAFHFEILKDFIPTFESVGNILIEKLSQLSTSDSIDIYPILSLCTLDVICETAMGTKINAQSHKDSEYVRGVKMMCSLITERAISVMKLYKYTFRLTPDYYRQIKTLKLLHQYSMDVINRKRQAIKEKMQQEDKANDDEPSQKMAFLDLLLKFSDEGEILTLHEIREQVDTFMFEGHDTTASAISFILYCLANHQDVQEKAFQEQRDIFGENKNPLVSHTELQEMKYLECVIKETIRLYPPVPLIGRYTTEDVEYDECIIPKGINIGICIYAIHRNPEYFPNPEKFDPNRFENFDNSLPYAYIPFSAGSRNCIGQKFAMLEMKSIVSKILRNFHLLPAIPEHKLILVPETVLQSQNGIKIGFQKRS